jgi:hypothetical protein
VRRIFFPTFGSPESPAMTESSRPAGRYQWKGKHEKGMKKPLGKQDRLWYSVFAFVALVSPLDV